MATEPPSAANPDLAWTELPRERRDFAGDLVTRPETADARLLVRSMTFNPHDTWLSPTTRSQVAAAIAESASLAEAQALEYQSCSDREFAEARATGQATRIALGDGLSSLRVAQLGPALRLVAADGATFAVHQRHFPAARHAANEQRQLGLALFERLAGVFVTADAITQEAAAALVARAREVAFQD